MIKPSANSSAKPPRTATAPLPEAEEKKRAMWARIPRLAEVDGVLARTGSLDNGRRRRRRRRGGARIRD